MPEKSHQKLVFNLLEVCNSIEKTLKARYGSSFWVKAEINKLNFYPRSGHAYPELVQKKDNVVLAEMRSLIWANRFEEINQRFLKILGEPIKDGIQVLFEAQVDYNAKYGLSLHILDIDVSYTLGELQREKQENIRKLKEEGLFDANKKLPFPLLPKRIAIISVETSKGYSDFLKIIDNNSFGYRFFHMLFPALLQGEKASSSIIAQLQSIKKLKHHFDVVCIIRGGGGDVGLSSFNEYELSKAVAGFPLPVLSGIGHSTNETVCEMVSFRSAITPTELGDFLLQAFHNFSVPVQEAARLLQQSPKNMLAQENLRFSRSMKGLKFSLLSTMKMAQQDLSASVKEFNQLSNSSLKAETKEILILVENLSKSSEFTLKEQVKGLREQSEVLNKSALSTQMDKRNILESIERLVKLSDPINNLRLGYSITKVNGRLLRSVEELKKGQTMETIFADGKVSSSIKEIKHGREN